MKNGKRLNLRCDVMASDPKRWWIFIRYPHRRYHLSVPLHCARFRVPSGCAVAVEAHLLYVSKDPQTNSKGGGTGYKLQYLGRKYGIVLR